MASTVAKRTDHRVTRSASWSVTHSDEELARMLQMQEDKEYQDTLTAKEVQCKRDHRLAQFLSQHDGQGTPQARPPARPQPRLRIARRSASNFTGAAAAAGTNSLNATIISITDSDTDFSDCFEDTTFEEISTALAVSREEADRLEEQQGAAEALARDELIAQALQNDEQLNRMVENELELSGSVGEPGDDSTHVASSPSSPIYSGSDLSDHGNESIELSLTSLDASGNGDWPSGTEPTFSAPRPAPAPNSSLFMSVNVAWNVVGSAVTWVSELFSGGQTLPQSSVGNKEPAHAAGSADEEDDDEEEEEEACDDDDDGWDDEDSDDFDEIDDNDDDEEDVDDDLTFGVIDSDMDDSDDDNVEVVNGHVVQGRGLVQEEIDILPTRTFHSRPPLTATARGVADASADEHQRQNECQVCISCFADGEVLRTLPCCHQFHSECIDVWLQRNAICPVCRVRIRDEIGCR